MTISHQFNKRLKDIGFALTRPDYWIRAFRADKHVDYIINKALDTYPIVFGNYDDNTDDSVFIGPYRVRITLLPSKRADKTLAGLIVSTQNESGNVTYYNNRTQRCLPYRRTANRLITQAAITNSALTQPTMDPYDQFIEDLYKVFKE